MYQFFIFIISVSMLVACKPSASATYQQSLQTQKPDAFITFGRGGGFTGKSVYYMLDNMGSLHQISDSDTVFIKKIDEEIKNKHFSDCKTIVDQHKPINKPGNMFSIIRFTSKDNTVEYIWGLPQYEVPHQLSSLFDSLQELP